MGVAACRARTGREATRLIQTTRIDIAVVDLSLPLDCCPSTPAEQEEEGGVRLLDLLRRLETPPPTLVVKRPRSRREDGRVMSSALSAGAFAVIERPVQIELILEAMRRVLRRHYSDRWPCGPSTA